MFSVTMISFRAKISEYISITPESIKTVEKSCDFHLLKRIGLFLPLLAPTHTIINSSRFVWFSAFPIKQEISYDSPRGRIAMKTHASEMTTSYLLIHDADTTDSGIYICSPTSGGRTSIKVHVFLHGKFL